MRFIPDLPQDMQRLLLQQQSHRDLAALRTTSCAWRDAVDYHTDFLNEALQRAHWRAGWPDPGRYKGDPLVDRRVWGHTEGHNAAPVRKRFAIRTVQRLGDVQRYKTGSKELLVAGLAFATAPLALPATLPAMFGAGCAVGAAEALYSAALLRNDEALHSCIQSGLCAGVSVASLGMYALQLPWLVGATVILGSTVTPACMLGAAWFQLRSRFC